MLNFFLILPANLVGYFIILNILGYKLKNKENSKLVKFMSKFFTPSLIKSAQKKERSRGGRVRT